MITPEEIRAKALKLWNSQRVLRAHLEGISLFPWMIPVAKPSARELAAGFQRMKDALRLLRLEDKETVGYGYRVEYQRVNHRRLGDQSLPDRVIVDSLEDFLRLIEKQAEFQHFKHLGATILETRPELRQFLARRPFVILENADDWSRLLAVCRYFQDHPKPNLYLRQLEIPGVDTKFIESRRALLSEMLELILPVEAKNTDVTGLSDHGFERRFGLRVEAPMIRFRLLDASCSLNGLKDVSATLPEFARLSLPVSQVFLIENKMNGLCFPDCPNAMVIFGLGYGAGCLTNVPWLQRATIYYWGDIDTHGFAILDHLRGTFPGMKSFLMDEKTLLLFKELWGREELAQRFIKDLARLTPEEGTLFKSLRDNRWGDSVRLEQERIAFGHVRQAVMEIASEIRSGISSERG